MILLWLVRGLLSLFVLYIIYFAVSVWNSSHGETGVTFPMESQLPAVVLPGLYERKWWNFTDVWQDFFFPTDRRSLNACTPVEHGTKKKNHPKDQMLSLYPEMVGKGHDGWS